MILGIFTRRFRASSGEFWGAFGHFYSDVLGKYMSNLGWLWAVFTAIFGLTLGILTVLFWVRSSEFWGGCGHFYSDFCVGFGHFSSNFG